MRAGPREAAMSKKLWGGRFNKKTNPLVEEFTKSIQFDYKLAEDDCIGSILHVGILNKAGYLSNDEAITLKKALYDIYREIEDGKFQFDKAAEDIHSNIQNVLQEKVGDLVLKLQTARSRNDQVVFATKVYSEVELIKIKSELETLISAISTLANKNKVLIIPGFTHLQHAQPVYLKDYLNAYVEMLKRDIKRVEFIANNIIVTMGAGSLAGTPIDADKYAKNTTELIKGLGGKSVNLQPTKNSLDVVSDRDFVIEIISALSIVAMHLSRLAEDFIIWSTKEFDFIEIDESFCTGSSLMPQKKNLDTLELIRGYAGRLFGNLVSVLTMMKGLPLTYNRDMQLDKEPLFNSLEVVSYELKILTGIMQTLKFNEAKIKEHLKDESLYATDLVYYLVDKKVAFKDAHTTIGKLISYSLEKNKEIKSMSESELKKFSPKLIKKEFVKLFDPKISVESKKSIKR